MTRTVVAGIDIGGTNTAVGLVDPRGEIVFKTVVPTKSAQEPKDLVDTIFECLYPAIKGQKLELRGVGIGAPNGNNYNGTIEFAPNLPWKGVVPLAELFNWKFKVPVKITNDANAAALGEMIFGAARNLKHFIFITLGTGVGSGIVVDGKLVYGHDGFAGEIGHVIIEPNGRLCGCGRKGCVETYCSAGGIVKTYQELSGDNTPLESKDVTERALKGCQHAVETFNITAKYLAFTLANSVAYTSPQAIFIFGGPANAGNLLLAPLKKMFEENLLEIYKNKVQVLHSGLPENDAAILGAASLVL